MIGETRETNDRATMTEVATMSGPDTRYRHSCEDRKK